MESDHLHLNKDTIIKAGFKIENNTVSKDVPKPFDYSEDEK